jgi:hypothetical protein
MPPILVDKRLAFLDAYPFSFPTFVISQVIFLNFWKKGICLEGMATRVSPYIRIINQQQFHWDPIGFRKDAGVWEDLLCEVRTIQWYQDFRMHLPRLSSSRPQGARMIKTGSPEWRTTVSVILPNVHPFTPDHPCVHMAIRLSGVLRPNEII